MTGLALDHLVLAARTLDEGVAWCESTLGITPGPGGRHPLMGTHNRLFSIASEKFPKAYFEVIAIDPEAPTPGRPRWFDLDDVTLQQALQRGPQFIHWAVRTRDLGLLLSKLSAKGFEGGEVLAAERDTPAGRLRWFIGIRPDGKRLCQGALPTGIEWGEVHPTDKLPASGVALEALTVSGVPEAALNLLGLPNGVNATAAPNAPALRATLASPHGRVAMNWPSQAL
jgi:hypothetical protein